MIFGYTLPEAKKTVVSFISLVGAVLAFVLSEYDPTWTDGFVALAGAVFAVVGVFMAKNHTTDDLSKAVTQLQGAALTVVGYFATVDPGTEEKIAVLAGAVVSVIGVWWARNEGRAAIQGPAPMAEGQPVAPNARR